MHEPLFSNQGRVACKGQLFSAPMDWRNMLEQIEASDLLTCEDKLSKLKKREQMEDQLHVMHEAESLISVPVTGAILAQRVRIVIAAGLVDLNKLLKQATIRREIVIQLVRMHRDAKHPDYQRGSQEDIELRAHKLAPTEDPNEPMIPPEVIDLLPNLERDDADGPFTGECS